MCMCSRAGCKWSGARPAIDGGGLRVLGWRPDAEEHRGYDVAAPAVMAKGGRKRRGVNAGPHRSIYKGPTGSARCGSFHSTELALTAMSRKFRETISPDFTPTYIHSMDSLVTYTLSLGRENNKAIRSS
jgi:hypothetical protein